MQANLNALRHARLQLTDGASGASAEISESRLLQLERINQRIIEAVRDALRELGVAHHEMAGLEQQNAAGYN